MGPVHRVPTGPVRPRRWPGTGGSAEARGGLHRLTGRQRATFEVIGSVACGRWASVGTGVSRSPAVGPTARTPCGPLIE